MSTPSGNAATILRVKRLVIASTLVQAELAARQLGLTRGEWRYVVDARALRGIRDASTIIVVLPVLGEDRRRFECDIALRSMEGEPEVVWT